MVAVAGVTVVEPVAADEPDGQGPTRILLIGDSITHGSAGDWTWRYRLWQHLVASYGAERFDFVGPADDVHEASHNYVDPAFDRDHGSRWGHTLHFPYYDPQALVSDHQPDVVVVLLGLNDLVWLKASPAGVANQADRLIERIRAVRPGIDVVLSRIPNHDVAGVDATNELLTSLAAQRDTDAERVVVADADAGFVPSTATQVEDTYDLVHPSSRGEVKIAAAVADALASLGIGTRYQRPLPVLPLGPRTGAVVTGTAGDESALLSWSSSAGTTGQIVWLRDVTAGTAWARRGPVVTGTATTVDGLVNGHRYRLLLRPVKGWAEAEDTASNVVALTPTGAAPQAPRRVQARARDHAVALSWRSVRGASSFIVSHRRSESGAAWETRTVDGREALVRGLQAGYRHEFRVQAVRDDTVSVLSSAARATPTGPRPKAPVRLSASRGPARSVELSWRRPRHATHFLVWYRALSRGGKKHYVATSEPLTGTSVAVPDLSRGARYSFRVGAWHQGVPGGVSSPLKVRLRAR
jgi:hypothetical protein